MLQLKDICAIDWGNTSLTKKSYEEEGKYLAVSATGADGKISYYEHEADVCVLSAIGAQCGKMFFPQQQFTAIKNTITLTPNREKVNSKYLYYLLTYIDLLKRGAAQPFISKGDIEKCEIPYLPPLAEQQRIVAKLDAVFAKIDEAINKAEAKETEIQKLKTSLLSSSLNGDDLMWKKIKISDVCQIQPKKAQVKLKLKDSDEVSFMPMKDLGIQSIYPKSTQIKKLEKVYNSYTYFEDNDILLAKITPCFENGKLGIASNLINGVGFGSSEYIVLRCSEEVIPQYIYFCLNQPSFRIIGENQMSGAVGHKRVPIEYVENTEIYLPPIADQERIVAKLDAANTEFRNANESIAKSKANYLALKSAILAQELKSSEAA